MLGDIKNMQKSLEDIEWDEENPISENTVDEWVKLEIGDTLTGVYVDHYKDKKYDNNKFIFNNATIIRAKNNEKKHYNKIGMNSSGNLDFILNNDDTYGPLKIIRTEDGEKKDKPNAPHHFIIIQPKQK